MNTTFTTCAEKKAKQFLNLLQGYTKGIRMTAILILLLMGVNNAWAYTAHFSLMGNPTPNGWTKDTDFMINTGTGTDDEWYIYAYVSKNQYFALNNGSNQYGPTTENKEIKNGSGGGTGDYNSNAWKFVGSSGIIKICCAESNNREWYPYVWVEESAPTIKFKHPWNGNSWSEQTATKQSDGTYTYDGQYGNKKAFNAGPSGKYKYNESATTVEGSPATGDMCRFIWNPVGYVQGGAETKASGTFKIVKLCSLTYDGNGKTGGTVPSATNNQLYNTSITLSSETLTKAGYTHTGWNTKADGTGNHYDKGASYELTATSATLYAEWTPVNYTITYNTNGGSGTMTPTSYTIKTATFDLPTPTKTGYTFEGWYENAEFNGNKITQIAQGSTGDKTLYAKWEQNAQPSITISTEKTYLRTAYDKLTLNIDYSNIPEGHTYRVHATPEAYFNGNENGDNIDRVSISGNGKTTFVSHGYLAQNTYTVEVILWDNNGATTIKSNQITIIVEPQLTVQTRARFNNQISTTAAEHPQPEWVHPSQNIGETITANNPNQGYTFAGWIANDDNLIEFEDPNSLTTIVKSKVNGNNTAVAYADYVKETCVYFINTSEWNEVAVYAWNNNNDKNANWPGVAMTKTGEQIGGYDVYKYCTQYEKLIFNNNNNGQQTGDLTWETGKYYVYDTWYEREEVEQALQDMKLYTDYYLVGEMNSWNETANAFKKATTEANTASVTFSLAANTTYEFKVKIKNGNWFGYNGDAINATTSDLQFINNGGENCSLKTTIEGEYTFTWNLTNSKLSVQYPTPIQYNITYHLNGGTNPNDAPTSYNVTTATFDLPTPTKTGYTFEGWYTASDFSGSKVTQITKGSTGDKEFWAKWTPTTYNITYKDQGDKEFSGTHEDGHPTQHTYATDTQLKGAGKMGYTFLGWHTDAACNNKVTILGATAYTANITLYAKWETRNLYIHADFVNNWGTPAHMTQDENNKAVYTYTTTLESKAGSQASPYNEGYHFHFVNTDAADPNDNKAYTYHDVQTPTGTNIDGPHLTDPGNTTIQFGLARKSLVTIILTLQSPNDDPKPTVEINANHYYTITRTNPINGNYTIKVGTNEAVSTDTESFADKTITLSATPNSGYHFVGWTVTKTGGETVTVIDNKFTMPAEDVTIAAIFEPNTYTITYNDLYDVTHSNPTAYTIESETIIFAEPTSTRTGYTFAGWDPTQIAQGSTGNKTVTAQWTEILSTITITTNPAEGGSVKVNDEPFESGHTVQVGVATTKQVTTIPNEGYGVTSWEFKGAAKYITGGNTVTLASDGSGNAGELIANYIPISRNIQFDKQSGEGGTETATVTYTKKDYSPDLVVAPTRTGYTFGGYYSEEKGAGEQVVSAEGAWLSNANGYTDADGNWLKSAENTTLYAKWTAKQYTVTLNPTDATTAGTPSVNATYDADMPSATMPTKTGYVFGGYYDQQNGQGTQYYKADGTSARTWNKADNTTLYAYFITPQIEVTLNGSTFEPGTASVTATATVTPAPADGTTVICWSLLYSGSENEVAGHEPTPTNGNSVQFSIGDLAAGSYIIKAILREGTGCEGTEISSATKTFLITSSHTITIKYTCDGKEIQASTTQEAQVSSATTITAPNIFGYTFSNWEAGDGVTINGNTSSRTITYTAIYDGYLTAKYNVNNNIVYFKNTLGWNKVYVYTFSDNAWWDTGSVGVHPEANKREQGEMIRMGDTDIYYFALSNPDGDYTQDNNANKNYIAFSNQDWRGKDAFNGGQAIYRGDHKNNLTLFIPQTDQTPKTYNSTKYYSTGIWMKYNSTESGYQLAGEVPNDDPEHDGWGTWGNKFTAPQPGNYIFTITKHLNANTTYKFKIKNYVWVKDYSDKDNNQWFGNFGTMTSGNCTGWHFKGDNDEGKNNGDAQITTNAAGEYKFIIDLSQGKVLLSVEYPIAVGDYRVIYKDNATWSQGATAHDANWYHPSRIIKKNKTNETTKDIISFFISHGNNPTMKFQKVTSITNGNVTWEDAGAAKIPDNITKPGVYNFIVTQTANGTSISMEEQAEPYTGNYYIRCDAVGGKWDNYKTDKENRMTYSAFSESVANSFGEKYSHYVTKYCPHGTNIKFTVANDYSPCISDTLVRDFGANNTVNPFGNLDENGKLITDGNNNDKYSANVRFMWNHKTNKISRAYIGRAVTNDFLVIDGNKTLHNSKGAERDTIVFFDTQNWIYEVKMKVQPTTRVKVYAAYPAAVGETKAQYFCGAYNNDAFNNDEDSKLALGGDANDQNYYSIRVLYDFKTNRLLMAWMPSGDTENVDGTKTISADVMLIRDHQNPAQCITFANEDSKLSEVKTVYGSMRFNRWVLNNRGGQNNFDVNSCGGADSYDENTTNHNHPVLQPAEQKSQYERALYFISFPFDVNVSDIFGFGTYGQHWIIEYYDGLKRAREGYWIDSDPNWKYVTNPDEFVLEKYKGYILCLNLGKMAYNNTDFWAHNISQVELFFPSTTTMSEIKRTEVTMPELGDEYLCKINRNTPEGDRRVKDSYWRCIGVPSYANYSEILTDGEQQPIQWQTSYTTFPFLYAWNMTDNTLTPQSTTNFNFKTMHAYLVQNGGKIHWSAVSATPKPSNIVARRQAADEVKNYEWKLTLSRNEQIEDQAFVRLSDNEQITTEFDFNQDLSKEFNYGRSDIYTLIGYEKAAANSLPITETTTLIPLGLSIEYNGDYTIAMPDRMENIGVTLIDTESNTRTNLSAGMEYTLTLNKGDYNNRFFIEISPAHQVPTDIEYIIGDSNNQDSVRKVLIDNILYIVRDGQMFDARGARVQ